MKERPILFSAPMVKALLAGRKTQTRRIVKPTFNELRAQLPTCSPFSISTEAGLVSCPYGAIGDRLWVKETWFTDAEDRVKPTELAPAVDCIEYAADAVGSEVLVRKLRPSLFMRRWMSRITLEIISVRAERLQAISEVDSRAEGIRPVSFGLHNDSGFEWSPEEDATDTAKESYRALWESINGAGSWALNPWVWVVEFRRVTP